MTVTYAGTGADISADGRYRYLLSRDWSAPDQRIVRPAVFIMLNPSTADANVDDPTIRRCVGFAKREGCSRLFVANLFAWRATDPAELPTADNPIGPDNSSVTCQLLDYSASRAGLVVAGWGASGPADAKAIRVDWLRARCDERDVRLWCLGTTKAGHPRHPLYVRSDQPLVELRGTSDPTNNTASIEAGGGS